jgi:single-stranded DNA-binding protein
MSIECAFHGFVAADADARISQAGKSWTRLRVGVGKDDDVVWVSIAVFGAAAETAGTLKKGDRCYVEGSIKLRAWRGQDGVERHELSVAAFKCEQTHRIGRNRPKRESVSVAAGTAAGEDQQKGARGQGGGFHSDDIPFAPEFR